MSTLPSPEATRLRADLQARIDGKTKPLGALGRLEALAVQLGVILGTGAPELRQPQMLLFAADHGLAAHGVSAYPAEVTGQMVQNFLAGGAAINVLARQHGLALTIVDAGIRQAPAPAPGLLLRRIGPGTADALAGPAMSPAQCQAAVEAGREVVRGLPGNAVLLGEMGIGNTSSAALLMARLTGEPLAHCTGRGTGLDDAGLAHKRSVLQAVLARHAGVVEPMAALAALGGFEIAMLCGAALEAAQQHRLVVMDGFITSSAVLVAARLQPAVLQACVFAHCSDEAGHSLLLRHLGAEPLLRLGLRLGEGSGAALAWPLLVSACRLLADMASFESAGVSRSS